MRIDDMWVVWVCKNLKFFIYMLILNNTLVCVFRFILFNNGRDIFCFRPMSIIRAGKILIFD